MPATVFLGARMLKKLKQLFSGADTKKPTEAPVETFHMIFLESEWQRLRFGLPLKNPNNERKVIKLFGHPGGKYDQR